MAGFLILRDKILRNQSSHRIPSLLIMDTFSINPPDWLMRGDFTSDLDSKPQKPPVHSYAWSDLSNLEPRKYLIKHLIDKGGMSVVYGESNSGKTFLALDIAAHISLGMDWQERNTKHGKVAYVASESGIGVAERLEAFRLHNKLDQYGDMHLVFETISLCGTENDAERLIQKIKEIGDVELVVIDTLARAMGSGNENSPDDMGSFIQLCDLIREKTKAHIMVIHHSGKDQTKGARGHSSLKAAIDTEIQVSQEDGIISAKVVKQRDGKTGDQFCFRLEVIDVGIDEDGDSLTSCVLLPTEAQQKKKKKSISPQARRALDILRNCLIDKGEVRHIRADMPKVYCVKILEYREYLRREKISSSDKPDSENKAITRSIDALNNLRITCSYGDFIWIADNEDKSRQT